ncbi:MAG TPA: hypothetical protein VIK12_08975 [Pengzhenrongella sp.]
MARRGTAAGSADTADFPDPMGSVGSVGSVDPPSSVAPAAVADQVPEHLRAIGSVPSVGLWLTEPVRGVLDAALLAAATP